MRLGHAAAGITARAAIRLAVEQCVDMVGGLYSGQIGVLVAAVRISNLLNDDGLDAVLQERLDLLARAEIDGFDLLSGKAGAIIGLISLAEMTKREDLLERAICLAQELIQAGCSSHRGVFWRPPGQAGGRPLLGLSHGIAGAALALLRLYERAGDESIRRLVERALAYEDSFYNPSAANWPDLRYAAGRGRSFAAPFQSMWCHGAPGIAISRLHATRLLGHEVFRRDLTAAVATTRRSIEVTIETDPVNFCLCHGIAGNADILLSCSPADTADVRCGVGDLGIERYTRNEPWPCGVTSAGESPGLFLGTAGIGYFYLRLGGAPVPSILDPDPRELSGNQAERPESLSSGLADPVAALGKRGAVSLAAPAVATERGLDERRSRDYWPASSRRGQYIVTEMHRVGHERSGAQQMLR